MSCNHEWLSPTLCRYMFCIVDVYMFVSAYHIREVQNFGVEVLKTVIFYVRREMKRIILIDYSGRCVNMRSVCKLQNSRMITCRIWPL